MSVRIDGASETTRGEAGLEGTGMIALNSPPLCVFGWQFIRQGVWLRPERSQELRILLSALFAVLFEAPFCQTFAKGCHSSLPVG